jgi:chromosomal replication initiator protein
MITLQEIADAVAEAFGTTVDDMRGPCRHRDLVRARFAAMLMARRMTRRSLPEIGRWFGGRDHTTVLNAVARAEGWDAGDDRFRADLAAAERAMGACGPLRPARDGAFYRHGALDPVMFRRRAVA